MPVICRFFGIIIRMYFDDYTPAHFHAFYGDFSVVIAIESGEILRGSFPRKQLKQVMEWCNIHRPELLENWRLGQNGKPLNQVEAP